jgi:hypothetical protein
VYPMIDYCRFTGHICSSTVQMRVGTHPSRLIIRTWHWNARLHQAETCNSRQPAHVCSINTLVRIWFSISSEQLMRGGSSCVVIFSAHVSPPSIRRAELLDLILVGRAEVEISNFERYSAPRTRPFCLQEVLVSETWNSASYMLSE